MPQELALTTDETQVITNISRSFAIRMRWNIRWEYQDIYQELCLFWLKRKISGWKKPHGDWKGAMGYCLLCHLKDIQRGECSKAAKTRGSLLSLDLLIEDGFDIPIPQKTPFFFDFQSRLGRYERRILELLSQGQSKKTIAQRLGKSRAFVHKKLCYVRHLAEEKVPNLRLH